MRSSTKILSILASTGIILAATVAPAMAADTKDVSGTVTGTSLGFTTSAATLTNVTLDGKTVGSANGTASAAWTVTDARGTGAQWALTASATDFTSAAGTDETARTIAATNLVITPGTIAAGTGSDAAPTATALTMTNAAQTLVTTGTTGAMGNYSFTPTFELSIPVNAFASNALPYVSVVTYTIG